jgi:hypothetical protein
MAGGSRGGVIRGELTGRGGAVALVVGDDLDALIFPVADARVRGAEVDANGQSFNLQPEMQSERGDGYRARPKWQRLAYAPRGWGRGLAGGRRRTWRDAQGSMLSSTGEAARSPGGVPWTWLRGSCASSLYLRSVGGCE